MNPKINKLKADREKNNKKIAALQQRNREIDDSIHELKIWILSAWYEAAA